MQERRPVLIDTDTASDDAVALIMALRSRDVSVKAITTVAGNVDVEQATQNALFTVELCGAHTPVYMGASGPLERPLETARWFHGQDGLGDQGYAPASHQVAKGDAVDAIIACALAHPGLEVITLGPMTNLALAIAREPGIVEAISRCVVMGGAPCCEGNVTPAAEFNVWVDPEAARTVLLSGLNTLLAGWQLSRYEAVLHEEDIAEILAINSAAAEFAIRSNSRAAEAYHRQTGEVGISLPDPVAMGLLLRPELNLQSSRHFVDVETTSQLTRGMTVVDLLDVASDERNRSAWDEATRHGRRAEVCWRIDIPGWKAVLKDALR